MVQVVNAYCLISTGVRITCSNTTGKGNRSVVVSTNGNDTMKENVANIFGPKQLQSLLEFRQVNPDEDICTDFGLSRTPDSQEIFRIQGWVSKCVHGMGRSSTDRQFLFINRRPCDSMKISRLVNEVYHTFNRHQFPFFTLDITTAKDSVDVNVTPDKRQMFLQQEKFLLATLKASLLKMYDPTTSVLAVNHIQTNSGVFQSGLPDTEMAVSLSAQSPRSSNKTSLAGKGEGTLSNTLSRLKRSFSSSFARSDSSPSATSCPSPQQPSKQRRMDLLMGRGLASRSDGQMSKSSAPAITDFFQRSSSKSSVDSTGSASAADNVIVLDDDDDDDDEDDGGGGDKEETAGKRDLVCEGDGLDTVDGNICQKSDLQLAGLAEELSSSQSVEVIQIKMSKGADDRSSKMTTLEADVVCDSVSDLPTTDGSGDKIGLSRASIMPSMSGSAAGGGLPVRNASASVSSSVDAPASEPETTGDRSIPSPVYSDTSTYFRFSRSSVEVEEGGGGRQLPPPMARAESVASTVSVASATSAFDAMSQVSSINTEYLYDSDNPHLSGRLSQISSLSEVDSVGTQELSQRSEHLSQNLEMADAAILLTPNGDEDKVSSPAVEEERNPCGRLEVFRRSVSRTLEPVDEEILVASPSTPCTQEMEGNEPSETARPMWRVTKSMEKMTETPKKQAASSVYKLLEYDEKVENVVRNEVTVKFSLLSLKQRLENLRKKSIADNAREATRRFRAKICPTDNSSAEEELSREIRKEMFPHMRILGQFNLGFIITKLGSDLFIVDQHATDEKYNFEVLQRNTVISSQALIHPQNLELTASNEIILIDNLEIFRKNGFEFLINEDAPPTQRVKLTKTPISKNWHFGKEDIEELIFMLTDSPGIMCRPSRVRQMFASRACRKSIMIGTALGHREMKKLVCHMSELDQPWNCPHGRPTMRHLFCLDMLPK